MSEFVLSGQELFGRYARIAYGHALGGEQDYHIYKCIQSFRSNCYCDVPLTYQTENNCYNHENIVDVVDVIHCGIDENRVIRVALNDIELIPAPVEPIIPAFWKPVYESEISGYDPALSGRDPVGAYVCTNCGAEAIFDCNDQFVLSERCHKCGAHMDAPPNRRRSDNK